MKDELSKNTINLPFQISATGVYQCIRFLCNYKVYDIEKGWQEPKETLNSAYRYDNILKFIKNTFPANFQEYAKYNGNEIWDKFFMNDPFLSQRIQNMNISSIEELYYAAKSSTIYKENNLRDHYTDEDIEELDEY